MKKMIYNDNILQFWDIDMQDTEQTRDQLISELTILRKRVKELGQCEAERTETEEALARSEEVFLDLFNATEEIAFLMETDGTILIANNNSARFYGIASEHIVGKSIYDTYTSRQGRKCPRKSKGGHRNTQNGSL